MVTTYPNTIEKDLLFGLRKKLDRKQVDYRWGKPNKCISENGVEETCEEHDVKPIENLNKSCYSKIQDLATIDKNRGVNKCIEDLNASLRCKTAGDVLRCPVSFNASQLKDSCVTEDNALRNIVDYCINHTSNPAENSHDICDKVYKSNELKKISEDTKLSDLIRESKYSCGDNCNLNYIEAPTIKKYTYKNNLKSTVDNLNCHEMSKLIYDCKQLKEEDIVDGKRFKDYYNDFVKHGKYDYDAVMDTNPAVLDKLAKYGMCKIAMDNIDIIKGQKIDQSITEWWNYNIFNNKPYKDDDDNMHESGFQRNIFYVSFFIVLFLKLTILSKFNIMPGTTTYLNKVLPILTIIFSLVIFYGFVNKLDWISTIARIVFFLFSLAIIFGFGFYIKDKIWSKDDSSKQVSAILLVIGCFILVFKGLAGPSDNNVFISVSIILYFIFISTYFILKSEKSTIIFKMSSILIICLLLVIYLFYTKDLLFNIIYFYVFIFIILIFIICANNTDLFSKRFNNNTASKYVKIINIVLRPFKSDNKIDSSSKIIKFLILGFYFIFAFADSFISVLSPQVSLVIMITFRLILNRWFEPINGVFASLSGYSMSNIEGTYERLTTTNRGVLDIDNLLSFFIK